MHRFDKSRDSDPLPRLIAMAAKPEGNRKLRACLDDPGVDPAFLCKVLQALNAVRALQSKAVRVQ